MPLHDCMDKTLSVCYQQFEWMVPKSISGGIQKGGYKIMYTRKGSRWW
jgi:hypothetical protein